MLAWKIILVSDCLKYRKTASKSKINLSTILNSFCFVFVWISQIIIGLPNISSCNSWKARPSDQNIRFYSSANIDYLKSYRFSLSITIKPKYKFLGHSRQSLQISYKITHFRIWLFDNLNLVEQHSWIKLMPWFVFIWKVVLDNMTTYASYLNFRVIVFWHLEIKDRVELAKSTSCSTTPVWKMKSNLFSNAILLCNVQGIHEFRN